MRKTRDCRTLGEYIKTFEETNTKLMYDEKEPMSRIGIIERKDSEARFIALLRGGKYVTTCE